MRVAVLSCYNGAVNRGVESWCINFCEHLQGLGHTCLLLQGGSELPRDTSFRVARSRMPMPWLSAACFPSPLDGRIARFYVDRAGRGIARFSLRAVPRLIAFRPDVIVPANNLWTVVGAKLAGWVLKGRPRIVVTSQAGWTYFERDDLRIGVDGFVAIQPSIYLQAVEFDRGRTHIRLIPNGVEVQRFAGGPAATLGLKAPIAIVVSALDNYKRVDLAVRAVAAAGLSLLVVGDGRNADRVDKLGDALLGPGRFLRVSRVPYNEVAAYFRAADVFTLPSEEAEAFGIVVLEALAAGLPVVVNDDPVRRWITGDHEWYVNPENVDQYAEALRSAVERGQSPASQARLAQFSWPVVASEYASFFAELAQPTRTARWARAVAPPRLAARVAARFLERAMLFIGNRVSRVGARGAH